MSLLIALAVAAALADPRDILRANDNASGGSAWADKMALKTEYDTVREGKPGPHGTWIVDLKAPRYYHIVDVDFTSGYDGKTYWVHPARVGLVTRDKGPAMERPIGEAYLTAHLWWRADLGGATAVYDRRETLRGEDCDVITVTPASTSPITAWFSVKTGLLLRTQVQFSAMHSTTDYLAYRSLDGAMIPEKIETSDTSDRDSGSFDETFTLTAAQFLPEQDASTFAPQ